MKPVTIGTLPVHALETSANFTAVSFLSTVAAPKVASVTTKSRASTGMAGTSRSVRARASRATEMRSPVLMMESRVRAEHSRVSSTPESRRSTGVRMSSRSCLRPFWLWLLRTVRPVAVASSRTWASSRRAWLMLPSAADLAARMSQSVLSPSADTTSASGRGAAPTSSSTLGNRPEVPREEPPNL